MTPELLPHLFRTEYSKIIAVLCHTFGLDHIETAEDIASETFLKAAEIWSQKGLPPNPAAWLYTVAKNQTKDYYRRKAVFEQKVKGVLQSESGSIEEAFEINEALIADSQLAMIFAVCHPGNAPQSQICLALQVLCGFSVEEIAGAFLTNIETIKKRLQRARTTLREDNFQLRQLSGTAIHARLDTVLQTIYLLFNEGYFSNSNSLAIRKDLCSEAIRLATLLTENEMTNTPQANALLALCCFQASRLDARTNEQGDAVLLEQQDRRLWDTTLIDKGNQYLIAACRGDELSRYHLEAAIAYWHATPNDEDKWHHILLLYDQLLLIDPSPVIALNRAFAVAKVHGHAQAMEEVKQWRLEDNPHYHSLLGYLYGDTDIELAIQHYTKAASLTKSATGKQTLQAAIERLQAK